MPALARLTFVLACVSPADATADKRTIEASVTRSRRAFERVLEHGGVLWKLVDGGRTPRCEPIRFDARKGELFERVPGGRDVWQYSYGDGELWLHHEGIRYDRPHPFTGHFEVICADVVHVRFEADRADLGAPHFLSRAQCRRAIAPKEEAATLLAGC